MSAPPVKIAKRKCLCTVGYCCNPCWARAAVEDPCHKTDGCENPASHAGECGPCVNTQRVIITEEDIRS